MRGYVLGKNKLTLYQMFSQSKGLVVKDYNSTNTSSAIKICQNLLNLSINCHGKKIIDGPLEVIKPNN